MRDREQPEPDDTPIDPRVLDEPPWQDDADRVVPPDDDDRVLIDEDDEPWR